MEETSDQGGLRSLGTPVLKGNLLGDGKGCNDSGERLQIEARRLRLAGWLGGAGFRTEQRGGALGEAGLGALRR